MKGSQTLSSQGKTQSPPDVAIFVRSLYGGGSERMLVTLAQGFVERGLKVDLALARAEGHYSKEVHPEVRIVDLKAQWVTSSLPAMVKIPAPKSP